jgi:60s Acidic ribosomal protein
LEGKDVKDLLLNVGSGGGAAAPAAGGAAAATGGEAAAEEKKEEKEEGTLLVSNNLLCVYTDLDHREGRVRRGHGFRSLRLKWELRLLCFCIFDSIGVEGVCYTNHGSLQYIYSDQAGILLFFFGDLCHEFAQSLHV